MNKREFKKLTGRRLCETLKIMFPEFCPFGVEMYTLGNEEANLKEIWEYIARLGSAALMTRIISAVKSRHILQMTVLKDLEMIISERKQVAEEVASSPEMSKEEFSRLPAAVAYVRMCTYLYEKYPIDSLLNEAWRKRKHLLKEKENERQTSSERSHVRNT